MTIAIALKTIWILLNVSVLAVMLVNHSKQDWEAQILMAYALLALSFPLGLVFQLFINVVGLLLIHYFGAAFPDSYVVLVLTWLGFFLIGYLQWFKLVPLLFRRVQAEWRKHKDSAAAK